MAATYEVSRQIGMLWPVEFVEEADTFTAAPFQPLEVARRIDSDPTVLTGLA